VAASLLAVLGFSFGLYQSVQVGKLSHPRWVHLVDEGATERGAGVGQSFSTQELGMIRLTPDDLEEIYPSYEAEIVREDEVVARLPLATLDEAEPILSIPPGFLEPGKYEARLYGIQGERRDRLKRVEFDVNAP
jgi:hypothetical protein